VLALRWTDVDFERGRLTVACVKTAHHDGRDVRQVPILPALARLLHEAFTDAREGAEFCITRSRDTTINLRTTLTKIIKRAGLTPWPKLFVNPRSSFETELTQRFPARVAAQWLGHSVTIAARHYLQVRDEDFARAAELHGSAPAEAQQKAQQTVAAGEGQAATAPEADPPQPPENTGNVAAGQPGSMADMYV
jgi:integrase